MHNLEINKKNPRKTWMLINELTSRMCGKIRNIEKIKNEIINSADEMAEAFNDFFTTIGSNLANEILPSDIEPESYPQPTDKAFSLKAPRNCVRIIESNKWKKSYGARSNSL